MFGNMFQTYDVTFEVYIEDKLVKKQTMQAPKEILMINFMQTIDQIGNDRRPIKIKMFRQENVWDNFENKEKSLDYKVEFSNNAMIAWEEEKGNEYV